MRNLRLPDYVILGLLAAVAVTFGVSQGYEQQPPAINFIWRILNVGLVVGIIWKLAGKAIASFFTGRSAGIARELEDIESRKEKARQDLLDVEKRIAGLESERKMILADYEARGEALKADIIAKAEQTAALIMTQAKQTAQNEIDNALAALREELADKIVDAASRSISGSLSAKDQEKLLQRALDSDELDRNFQDKGVLQ